MAQARSYRYYELVMAAFVTVLICSNLIGPAKIVQIDAPFFGPLTFGAAVLFFPISYVFGDILTEVYGYARARRVIWAGFAGLGFASFMAAVVVALPPAEFTAWVHKTRRAHALLDGARLRELSRPGAGYPVTFYSRVSPGLFDEIVNRYRRARNGPPLAANARAGE